MKIFMFPAYFYPEQYSSSYLSANLITAFVDEGYNIELVIPSPTRGIKDEIRKIYKKKKYEELYHGKVRIHRFDMFREKKNILNRAIRYLLCNIIQFHKGIRIKNVSLIYASSTPPTQGFIAALIKKNMKAPFVYCLQDIFPDSLLGTNLTRKGSLLWKVGRVIENFTYRNADKIIVISNDFKQNIMQKGVPESKIEVIYNWVDENAVSPISRCDNKLFDQYNLNRELFYVVYAGNLGHAQNIDIIIASAQKLKNQKLIKFLIFGSGGLEIQLKEKAIKLDLNNINFFPIQPAEKIAEVYSLGNVAIVSCKPGLGKSAMPSKTWSILSSGTAILANFDEGTELQKIIENNKVGLFTKAGEVESFSEAILKLFQDSALCEDFGRNGRAFILKNLTRKIGTSKYLEVIKSVVKQ